MGWQFGIHIGLSGRSSRCSNVDSFEAQASRAEGSPLQIGLLQVWPPPNLARPGSSSELNPPKSCRISLGSQLSPSYAVMRQRTTFIQRAGHAVDPTLLTVSAGSLAGPSIDAVREERLTIPLDELPDELQSILRGTPDLHIRWVSPRPFESVSPLFSRLPPGFHLLYTPRTESVVDR